jgi:hypothetical protein
MHQRKNHEYQDLNTIENKIQMVALETKKREAKKVLLNKSTTAVSISGGLKSKKENQNNKTGTNQPSPRLAGSYQWGQQRKDMEVGDRERRVERPAMEGSTLSKVSIQRPTGKKEQKREWLMGLKTEEVTKKIIRHLLKQEEVICPVCKKLHLYKQRFPCGTKNFPSCRLENCPDFGAFTLQKKIST